MEPIANTVPVSAVGADASDLHRAFIRALLLSQVPSQYTAWCRALAEAAAPDYSRITMPLLLIAGADDKTAPLSDCKVIFSRYFFRLILYDAGAARPSPKTNTHTLTFTFT